MREGARVVQLHDIDFANVVEVARVLVVGAVVGEGRVEAKLVGLVEQVEGQVVAQNQVGENGLSKCNKRFETGEIVVFLSTLTWSGSS